MILRREKPSVHAHRFGFAELCVFTRLHIKQRSKMELKYLCVLLAAALLLTSVSAQNLLTKIEFELDDLTGIPQLDNTNGTAVVVTISNVTGPVVSRYAAAGVYLPNMTIVMQGDKFNLNYNTNYTYNLSTVYGDFLYNFTTPVYRVDTSSGDAAAGDILSTKKAWVDGSEITGSIANCAADGNGLCYVAQATMALLDLDLTAGNIKSSVNIFGISGTALNVQFRTGKTTCYDATSVQTCPVTGFPRQDADISGATAKNFTYNGDWTVTDQQTGIMWTKNDSVSIKTWAAALSYCNGLSTGGYTNWHLPNFVEMATLVDFGLSTLKNNAFTWNTNLYWTSTPSSTPTWAYYANFGGTNSNLINEGNKAYDGCGYTCMARCAR